MRWSSVVAPTRHRAGISWRGRGTLASCPSWLPAIMVGFILVLLIPGGAEGLRKCQTCHKKRTLSKKLPSGRVISMFVDEMLLKESVHAKHSCSDCHNDIKVIPHKGEIKRVSCIRCHFKGNIVGAPQKDINLEFAKSVHGVAAAAGNAKAPVCQDCHGTHNILSPTDDESLMNKANIPETCGRCHLEVFSDYRESVHWRAFQEEKEDSAVCTDCHGEHTIRSHESPESSTYVSRVPVTCSRCHSSVAVVGKYGIKPEQVATYERSFHGIAIKFGGKTVANCASCHGVHDILPSADPRSAVHPDNIPETCGKCHEGANVNYAKGKIHVDPTKREAGSVYWISLLFKWLTISVMMSLVAHISLDLFRRFRRPGGAH